MASLPPVFARVHRRYKTPWVSTVATGVFVGAVSAVANIDEAVELTNIGTLFAFVLVCIGIAVLRRAVPGRHRPFRVPFGPWLVPSLGALSCVVIAYNLPRSSWERFGVWLVVGAVVPYASYGFRRALLSLRTLCRRCRSGRRRGSPRRRGRWSRTHSQTLE